MVKFLKKLGCCFSGEVKQNFGIKSSWNLISDQLQHYILPKCKGGEYDKVPFFILFDLKSLFADDLKTNYFPVMHVHLFLNFLFSPIILESFLIQPISASWRD